MRIILDSIRDRITAPANDGARNRINEAEEHEWMDGQRPVPDDPGLLGRVRRERSVYSVHACDDLASGDG